MKQLTNLLAYLLAYINTYLFTHSLTLFSQLLKYMHISIHIYIYMNARLHKYRCLLLLKQGVPGELQRAWVRSVGSARPHTCCGTLLVYWEFALQSLPKAPMMSRPIILAECVMNVHAYLYIWSTIQTFSSSISRLRSTLLHSSSTMITDAAASRTVLPSAAARPAARERNSISENLCKICSGNFSTT